MVKSTNSIIQQSDRKGDKIIYYVPAYVRLKIKNFLDVNLQSLNAQILATLNISISIKNFKQYIVTTASKARYQHLYNALTTGLLIKFSKDQSLRLNKDSQDLNMRFKQDDDYISFTVWKVFNLNIMTQKYWLSPFQLLNLRLTMNLDYIKTQYEGIQFIFKFNCMDLYETPQINYHKQSINFVKLSYVGDFVSFGQYTLAKAKLAVVYSCNKLTQSSKMQKQRQIQQNNNQQEQFKHYFGKSYEKRINQQNSNSNHNQINGQSSIIISNQNRQIQQERGQSGNQFMKIFGGGMSSSNKINHNNHENHELLKFKNWQYTHFIIPLFRTPVIDLLTIFLPLWLLGFINILIFFQDQHLADRLANIGAVMIAFSALIPTIRSQVPPAPQITLVQVMIYLQIATSLLALIQSYVISDQATIAQNTQNSSQTNPNAASISTSNTTSTYGDSSGNWKSDYLFITTIGINALTITVILTLFAIFFCCWRKSYLNVNSDIDQQVFKQIDKSSWKGGKCDIIFQKYALDNQYNKKFKFLSQQIQNAQQEELEHLVN